MDIRQVMVSEDGTLTLPAEAVAWLGARPGDAVTVEEDGPGLRLRDPVAVARGIQVRFAHLWRPGESVVDEFIAERRAEAARE